MIRRAEGGDSPDAPRFGLFHRALLTVLAGMVVLVVVTGLNSSRLSAQQGAALSNHVRQQSGSVSALQRDCLGYLLQLERWNAGMVDVEQVEVSRAVIERRFTTLVDEASDEPALADELALIRADLDTIALIMDGGAVSIGSARRDDLDAAMAELIADLSSLDSFSEARQASYIESLRTSQRQAQAVQWISGATMLVLGTVLIASLQRMFRTSDRSARERLRAEQIRHDHARATTERVEQRFREVVDEVNDVVFRADAEGRLMLLNRAWLRLTNSPADHALGRPLIEYVDPADRHRVGAMFDALLSGSESQVTEEVGFGPDSYSQTVVISARTSTDVDALYLAGTIVDTTDRTRAQRLAAAQAEILELVARGTEVGAILDRIVERISTFEPGVAFRFRPSGTPSDEVEQGRPADGTVPLTPSTGASVSRLDGEVRPAAPDPLGVLEWTFAPGARLRDDFESTVALVARLGALALDRQRSADRIVYQANHDSLTELPNRAFLGRRIDEAVEAIADTDREIALMFLDLDQFKVINDSLGHQAGDRLLVELSGRLRQSVRPSDTVARFGGDEFVILIESAPDRDHVEAIADRILSVVSEPVDVGSEVVLASTSIGIVFGTKDSTAEDLLKYADMAMYRAKQSGRGAYVVFDEDMQRLATERQVTERALRRALDDKQFEAWYQPIVDLSTHRLKGFEALVRWHRPGFGLVAPEEFIPLAEELGMIADIDAWMLDQAASQLEIWSALNPTLVMSVNVSGVELSDPAVVEAISESLSRHRCVDRLILEVTETAVLDDPKVVGSRLDALRRQGLRVAIDDFGTGYASLQYLRELAVDIIKIDRTFISRGPGDVAGSGADDDGIKSPTIVASVTELGHALGLEVVAEGVETPDQAKSLAAMGVDWAQGYLFGKPAPADEQTELVGRINLPILH